MNEFHIDERDASPEGEGITVAGHSRGESIEGVEVASATGGEDDGRRKDGHGAAMVQVKGERTHDSARFVIADEQVEDGKTRGESHAEPAGALEEGLDDGGTGFGSASTGSGETSAVAEDLAEVSIGGLGETGAPFIEFEETFGRLEGDGSGQLGIAGEPTFGEDVYPMFTGAVLGIGMAEGGTEGHPVASGVLGSASLAGDALVSEEDACSRGARLDCGAEACAAGTDYENVCFDELQGMLAIGRAAAGSGVG